MTATRVSACELALSAALSMLACGPQELGSYGSERSKVDAEEQKDASTPEDGDDAGPLEAGPLGCAQQVHGR
jgi:hypothetical protein